MLAQILSLEFQQVLHFPQVQACGILYFIIKHTASEAFDFNRLIEVSERF